MRSETARDQLAADVLDVDLSLLGSDGVVREQGVFLDDLSSSYENRFARAAAEASNLYEPLPPMLQAAHERRMALLDALPVGDLTDKVVVDYGVGSWGFACIYPRLQNCRFAVGIDISPTACAESARVSSEHDLPYGDRYAYLVSSGDRLRLRDQSIDLLFAGEAIEHVMNTDVFLDEIHRALRPGGTFILTTPNPEPPLYRLAGERYCVGPEHVSLLTWQELIAYLEPRFEIAVAKGFNSSMTRDIDAGLDDLDVAREWAATFENRPDLATGVIVMAKRRATPAMARRQSTFPHDDRKIRFSGSWERDVPLFETLRGVRCDGTPGSSAIVKVTGTDVLVSFWVHDWSGKAVVEVDGNAHRVDLHSPEAGFLRLDIHGLRPGTHKVRIVATGERDPRSHGSQVVLHKVISYERSRT